MNHCRTCKHWSPNANMIGAGTCLNMTANLMVAGRERFITAQNFGCVCHERGPYTNSLESAEQRLSNLNEFTATQPNQ